MSRNTRYAAPASCRVGKRPSRPTDPARFRLGLAALALLTGLTILPGCHDAPDIPVPQVARDDALPANLPAPSPLFAAVSAPAMPNTHSVGVTPMPPEPPDADSTARLATQPAPVAGQPTLPVAGTKTGRPVGTPVGTVPVPSRCGLLVCDPMAPPSSPGLADFGAGCGHWLHLMAAGQPALGRTPLWEASERVKQELGRTDLKLTRSDLAPLPSIIGITHVACGTIDGTPAHCTLTYRLYSLPDRRPVGADLSRTGTLAQVVAALPGMAEAMDARLGVRITLPAVGLSPDDLKRFGATTHGAAPSDADLLALSRMATRSPLPGMFLLETRASKDQTVLNRTVAEMMAGRPQNALVVSQIAYETPAALRPYAAQTGLLIRRFPQNALLAHTEVWQQRVWGSRPVERAAALRAAADSPSDPDSWLTPAQTAADIAQDLRQSRVAGDLSPREWGYLNRLYAQWEADTLEATRLDPRDGHAWHQLAEAATFAGDDTRAAAAFWQAQKLDTFKAEVYSWGLEMFQPKWGGDPTALERVAGLAAVQDYGDADLAIDVSDQLKSVGEVTKDPKYAAMATGVMARLVAADRAAVLKRPGDALAHWDLAGALAYAKDPAGLREATLEYRIAAHLLPNAPEIHYWLADTLDQRHKGREAVDELRRAVALDPFYAKAHFDLGYDLKHQGRYPEALSELHLAMRLDPRDADAHFGLGDLLALQHQMVPAAAEYSEAVRLSPYFPEAWSNLCSALDAAGRYDASLNAGEEAIHVISLAGSESDPEFAASVHDTMADDDLHKKAWDASLAQTRAAIGLNPGDAVAQENLAEAYWGQGRRAEARTQWEHVAALGNPQIAEVAHKMLASHP